MTAHTTPVPTDAEAWTLWLSLPITGHAPATMGEFARAVLARWGAQPAPAASPPPLTDEQIEAARIEVFKVHGADLIPSIANTLARAIEAAHGIKE